VGLDPRRLELLDEQVRAELAQVFPSLAAYTGGRAPALQDERYRIHRAVRELLERLAATQPLVLVLDDLHWADSGSIELLGALLHRPPTGPVLLALAARPRQVPERFSAAVERAHRTGTLVRLELAALSRDEALELVGDTVDRAAATTLFEESGGNPLYLEQLARSLSRTSKVTQHGSLVSLAGVEVPAAVAAALREELALVSEGARRVLDGAAVAGDPFEPELAAAAADLPEAVAIEALDELLRLDLVRATDVPRRFGFRHPLVRRAVYEGIPGGWRLTAHERSAEALAARGASAAARAHHVEQAGRHGDMTAVAVLREAGEALAESTPAGAARWFRAALRLLPEGAPCEERVALLMALAGSLAATGDFDESRNALLESLQLVPPDEPALRVRLTLSCANVEQLLARHAEARARVESTLETLDDQTSPEAGALMISLALDSFYRPTVGGWRTWTDQAIELATELRNRPLQAAALSVAAVMCSFEAEMTEGRRYSTQAAALIDAMDDEELAIRLDSIVHLTAAEAYFERFDEAIAYGKRALFVARATGQGELLPTLVPGLWTAMWMRGRLHDGAQLLDDAVEGARLAGNNQTLVLLLMNCGITAALAGDVEAALTFAGESWELARDLEGSIAHTWAGFAFASAHIEDGDFARAADVMIGACGGKELELIPGVWRALALEWLTRCWLELGRLDEAGRTAAAAKAVAAGTPLRLGGAWADRASAAVAFRTGDPAAAVKDALASAAVADEVGAPVEAALSHALAGRALAQAGEGARAIEELERAASAFDACGAMRYRDEAERDLRKLGRRVQRGQRGRSDGVGVASLTERELQVARLVVERKTNPEIAAELFLSLKTVETHLRHIFGKLGVSSRVEVARAVEGADAAVQAP
jgi:ATP/maltotriose-dependent transcriptional regulator MalT